MSRRAPILLLIVLAAASGARTYEIPDAVVVLESFTAALPGQVAESAPPRFVLLEDGQVFVGGTSHVAAGRLAGRELKGLDKRLSEVRRSPGLAGALSLGPGPKRHRLFLRKGRPLTMEITGDPARATAFLPLAALMRDLLTFDHGSLRPWQAASYALSAREEKLVGGCRPWPFAEPVTSAIFAPRVVAASAVNGWPTGASPASVCAGDKSYAVTFRPLLPGERP